MKKKKKFNCREHCSSFFRRFGKYERPRSNWKNRIARQRKARTIAIGAHFALGESRGEKR